MKTHKKFLFGCLKKGQIIFCIIASLIVISSCAILDVSSATEISGKETLDFTVVVDPGHGGVDVKLGQYIKTTKAYLLICFN